MNIKVGKLYRATQTDNYLMAPRGYDRYIRVCKGDVLTAIKIENGWVTYLHHTGVVCSGDMNLEQWIEEV